MPKLNLFTNYRILVLMKHIIFFFLLFIQLLCCGQSNKRFEIFTGTSLGIEQISEIEHGLYNTSPLAKNSPSWIQLYQIGCNYNYYTLQNIQLKFGLQIHEKGSTNSFVDLLKPPFGGNPTRSQSVVVYFLLSQLFEYQLNQNSILVGLTYGRDVFEFIPINIKEIALVLGFKRKLNNNFSAGLLFNQGIKKNLQTGAVGSYNSTIDLNIYFNF